MATGTAVPRCFAIFTSCATASRRLKPTSNQRMRPHERIRQYEPNAAYPGYSQDPRTVASPVPDPAGGPRARARAPQAHQGAQERLGQRTVLPGTLSEAPGDAGRADSRGARPDGGAAHVRRGAT